MNKEKIKNDLQEIIDICKDSADGYEAASNNIEYQDLKTLFLRLSQQRRLFIRVLKNEALKLNIDLNSSGTIKGFFHRNWMATKAVFSRKTNETIIKEGMIGEKAALEVYNSILENPELPQYLKDTLQEQQRLIKVVIRQLHDYNRNVIKIMKQL